MKKNHMIRLVLSALFLAIGFVLPFLTGQIPEVGSMLLPLHLPALICGFVCGWPWGLLVGFVLPIARSLLFGMPPLVPTALAMAFEMAGYGAVAGLLYQRLRPGRGRVYVALIGAMLVSTLENGLTICAVPYYVLPAVKGAVLALALVAAYATKKDQ